MKRLLLALAFVAFVLPAVPRAYSAEVTVDIFYNNLSGGSWIEVGDYGYCWQPDVAVSNPRWRPYADGYWAYTNIGWTWISYEDFGWATYHYGRWIRLARLGWIWVPGRDEDLEWGPAWVSWRVGGDYVGWAPLPPRGRVIYGHRSIFGRVDIEFDIGPDYYNFVDIRYIGEPVLRERIYESTQNVTYINQTVNVTNITYQNNVVYNYGPDYNTLSARSSRPIQRLTLERQDNVDLSAAAKSGALTKVEGDKLVVGAPTTIKKTATPVAPPTVKEKVTEAKVDKGWSGVSDPKAQEELKKKMQTEDAKKIPPPTTGLSVGAQAGASASPAASANAAASVSAATSVSPTASASPAVSASPAAKGKGKNKFEPLQPGASASPAVSAAPTMTPQLGKPGKGKQNVSGSPAGTASPPSLSPSGKEKGKFDRGNLGTTPSPGESSTKTNLNSSKSNIYKSTTPSPSETAAETPKGKGKPQFGRSILGPTPAQPGETSTELPKGKGKAKEVEPTGTPAGGGGNESPEGASAGGGKHKGQGANIEAPNAPAGAGPAGAERGKGTQTEEGEKGKGKKGEKEEKESPSPAPQ